MKKYAVIDSELCHPEVCRDCKAAQACPHNLIEQESRDEPPVIWSAELCVGCGKCVGACPMGAVFIQHGSQAGFRR